MTKFGDIRGAASLARHLPAGEFRFIRLEVTGIDNEPVLAMNSPAQREEEVSVFHRTVSTGDAYVALLAGRVEGAMKGRAALPVVRFADGEYAFYGGSIEVQRPLSAGGECGGHTGRSSRLTRRP